MQHYEFCLNEYEETMALRIKVQFEDTKRVPCPLFCNAFPLWLSRSYETTKYYRPSTGVVLRGNVISYCVFNYSRIKRSRKSCMSNQQVKQRLQNHQTSRSVVNDVRWVNNAYLQWRLYPSNIECLQFFKAA